MVTVLALIFPGLVPDRDPEAANCVRRCFISISAGPTDKTERNLTSSGECRADYFWAVCAAAHSHALAFIRLSKRAKLRVNIITEHLFNR